MNSFLPPVMLILSATPAYAQDLLGFEYVGSSVTLNYQTMAESGDELFTDRYTIGFSGTAEFNIGSNFGLDISIGQHESTPGSIIRTQSRYIDLNPYLRFENAELGFF
ncbi:hypothetical protein N9O61_05395 [Octadecabacter sp.]|nr:hypothetical protein [Octadecabacter sp.]